MNDSAPRSGPAGSPVVLVVDDEPNIRELLRDALRLSGFLVRTAATGKQALECVAEDRPDIILLDVMLPDLDGFTVARSLRPAGGGPPVVFLTARDTVADRIAGLTAGGDDYITKPFSLEEVVLRIRAILRRVGTREKTADGLLRCADLELDEEAHTVRRAGRHIHLSPREFGLLRYLMINADRVVSKTQILDRVWNHDFGGDSRIVESYISYLRRKIDLEGPPLIHTLRGVGYCLRGPHRNRRDRAR
ncbi:response regulator transcription factor [Streptosporangium sp. NPDC051022]|uniref:response regulator transcription factor n=1 Tax=Streptosporangium sp. NPDC051022 TaxID=3155752 RepID=UPI00342FA26F